MTAQLLRFPKDRIVGDNVTPIDTAMHRQLFVEMTTAQQDAWLDGVRERRLRSVKVYEALQTAKRSAVDDKTRATLQRECNHMDKELLALTRALEKVETRVNRVTALQQMLAAGTAGAPDMKDESDDD